jgi:hypothetical protein
MRRATIKGSLSGSEANAAMQAISGKIATPFGVTGVALLLA